MGGNKKWLKNGRLGLATIARSRRAKIEDKRAWIMGTAYIIGSFIGFLMAFALVWYLSRYLRTGRVSHLFKIAALLFGGWVGALVGIFVVISYDLPIWMVLITIVLGALICDALMRRRGYRPFGW